jgi:hypothetical protein
MLQPHERVPGRQPSMRNMFGWKDKCGGMEVADPQRHAVHRERKRPQPKDRRAQKAGICAGVYGLVHEFMMSYDLQLVK